MTHPIDTSPEAIAALLAKYTSAFGLASEAYDKGYRNAEKALAAEIARLTAERDEARAQVAVTNRRAENMHRRAQRAEGLNHRSAQLLETVLKSLLDALPILPTLPSPYPISPWSLFHRIKAAREHARAGSGRAWVEMYHYLAPKLDAAEDRVKKLEAALAARDAAMRNEGRRQAALLGNNLPGVRFDDRWTDYEHGVCDFQRAILATLEPEGGE